MKEIKKNKVYVDRLGNEVNLDDKALADAKRERRVLLQSTWRRRVEKGKRELLISQAIWKIIEEDRALEPLFSFTSTPGLPPLPTELFSAPLATPESVKHSLDHIDCGITEITLANTAPSRPASPDPDEYLSDPTPRSNHMPELLKAAGLTPIKFYARFFPGEPNAPEVDEDNPIFLPSPDSPG